MTALEDAREALAGFNGGDFTHQQGYPGMAAGLARALAALIAEHERALLREESALTVIERLTAPPTGDEREALIAWIDAWYDRTAGPGESWVTSDLADAFIAAGFRRQGPITDAQIEAARLSLWVNCGNLPASVVRAALEAAREADR